MIQTGLIDQKNLTLNAICNYLENTIPASCATEYKGNAVLFINLDLCTLTIHEISDKIEGFIKSSMLSAGYSRKMLGHFNFHRQYTQASVTLQVGKRKNPAESIHYFDSIALPYILEQATKKLPAYMVCHEKLLSMKYKDEAKQSMKHYVVFWSTTRTFLILPALYLSTEVLFFIVWIRSKLFWIQILQTETRSCICCFLFI